VTAWRSLLSGAERDHALAAVHAITESLARPCAEMLPYAHEVALLHAYVGGAEGGRAGAFVDAAATHAATNSLSPSLFRGTCGIGWAFAHLDPDAGESLQEVDELVDEALRRAQPPVAFDLTSGLVGFGIYALARLPSVWAHRTLAAIVRRLDESVCRDGEGLCWLTPPEVLIPSRRAESPAGHYDLGVAHGAAGVIAFLARARRLGVELDRTSHLLDGAVRWIEGKRAGRAFPAWLRPDGHATPGRDAWCYGAPGIALALFSAATNEAQRHQATAIALEAASRPVESSGVADAGICHGAAGLGHIYNRLHQATGDRRLGDAAATWFVRCLSLRREGEGIGGFRALWPTADGIGRWAEDGSLLTGAAGVALALFAACTDVAPRWDAMLLMDVDGD
jgi:hypothetical protein